MINEVERFQSLADDILFELRSHRRPAAAATEELLEAAAALRQQFEGKDSIPKTLAETFIDLPTALYASVEGLDADDAQPLFEFLDRLQDALRDICE